MINIQQVYSSLTPAIVSAKDVFFAGVFTVLGPLTTRDGLMGYATTGLGVVKQSDVRESERRRIGAVIVWTLLAGFIIAAAATIYCHYSYPTPLGREDVPGRNHFGSIYAPKRDIVDPFIRYAGVERFPAKRHDPLTHMGIRFRDYRRARVRVAALGGLAAAAGGVRHQPRRVHGQRVVQHPHRLARESADRPLRRVESVPQGEARLRRPDLRRRVGRGRLSDRQRDRREQRRGH
jgi:hypothetical protein